MIAKIIAYVYNLIEYWIIFCLSVCWLLNYSALIFLYQDEAAFVKAAEVADVLLLLLLFLWDGCAYCAC